MTNLIKEIETSFKRPVIAVKSGDTVAVHQRISEGSKQRVQVFEGLVIRVDRRQSLTYRITVRKISSGIAVERGFMMHAPNIEKVVILKRARVRRNYISYIRNLTGKSARLKSRGFDRDRVNTPQAPAQADSVGKTPAGDQPAAKVSQAESKKTPKAKAQADPKTSGGKKTPAGDKPATKAKKPVAAKPEESKTKATDTAKTAGQKTANDK